MEKQKLNIENADTQCPSCGKFNFYYKYYCEQEIFLCNSCWYWIPI